MKESSYKKLVENRLQKYETNLKEALKKILLDVNSAMASVILNVTEMKTGFKGCSCDSTSSSSNCPCQGPTIVPTTDVERLCYEMIDAVGPFKECHSSYPPLSFYKECVMNASQGNGNLGVGCNAIKKYQSLCEKHLSRSLTPTVLNCSTGRSVIEVHVQCVLYKILCWTDPCNEFQPCNNGPCTHNPGSFPPYSCGSCEPGYKRRDHVCEDIDEVLV